MSGITVTLDGLEDLVERIVEEKVAEVLAARATTKEFYTAEEATDFLGLKVSTIYDAVSDGRLKRSGAKGTKLRIHRDDLVAFARGRS